VWPSFFWPDAYSIFWFSFLGHCSRSFLIKRCLFQRICFRHQGVIFSEERIIPGLDRCSTVTRRPALGAFSGS